MAFMNGQFEVVFKDFDVELPLLTVIFLTTPWYVLTAIGLALAVMMVLAELVIKNKVVTSIMNIIIAVAVGILLLVWVVAMFLPLITLIGAVSH